MPHILSLELNYFESPLRWSPFNIQVILRTLKTFILRAIAPEAGGKLRQGGEVACILSELV